LMRVEGANLATAAEIAQSILDWRSPARSPGTAALLFARYRAAGLPAAPPGAPLPSRAAVAGVLGMPPALLARIRPHLSLFAPPVPILALADPVVRAAIKLAGALDVPGGTVEGPPVLQIEALAQGPGRARATRCAVVRLSPSNIEAPYQVLRWRNARCSN
jgi:general secretion pathway protein K